jgi:hypothetical protein
MKKPATVVGKLSARRQPASRDCLLEDCLRGSSLLLSLGECLPANGDCLLGNCLLLSSL